MQELLQNLYLVLLPGGTAQHLVLVNIISFYFYKSVASVYIMLLTYKWAYSTKNGKLSKIACNCCVFGVYYLSNMLYFIYSVTNVMFPVAMYFPEDNCV